jgi:hypothetical protein
MTVIKRSAKDSSADLVTAIDELIPYLKDQKETDAAASLKEAADQLRKAKTGTDAHKKAIAQVIDAFEGEHELMAYTFQRDNGGQWTEIEELSQASARVLSLARRMQ